MMLGIEVSPDPRERYEVARGRGWVSEQMATRRRLGSGSTERLLPNCGGSGGLRRRVFVGTA